MINILRLSILSLILTAFVSPCRAQTQAEMNAGAMTELQAAQVKLDGVIGEIRKNYRDDSTFLKQLEATQKAWEAFRDSQIRLRYPVGKGENAREIYGSVYPVCEARAKIVLVNARSKQLQPWLDGMEEGDVCAGSIKTH